MVNFCKKNFLHKRLVEILTQTPFSLVILTNIYLGLKKKKKPPVLGNTSNHKLFNYLKL